MHDPLIALKLSRPKAVWSLQFNVSSVEVLEVIGSGAPVKLVIEDAPESGGVRGRREDWLDKPSRLQ